jgi:hypothetical protein
VIVKYNERRSVVLVHLVPVGLLEAAANVFVHRHVLFGYCELFLVCQVRVNGVLVL